METEQLPQQVPPQNKPRKWEWVFRLALVAAGGTVYSGFDRFVADKPLYDTFQTKSESRLIEDSVKDVKTVIMDTHKIQMAELIAVRKESSEATREMRKYLDERRAARDMEIMRINDKINENQIDIAKLKQRYETKEN